MMITTLGYAERLSSGLEFLTPTGWTVKSNEQAAILLPPDMATEPGSNEPSELYIVATLPGVKDLNDPQVASILRGSYFPAATQTSSAGQAESFRAANGVGVLHRLDAVSQGVLLRVNIYAVGLSGGGVAGVLAIGRPAVVARREHVVAAVAASLSARVTTAAGAAANTSLAAQWDQRLRGRKLYQFSSYSSSYGSGGYNSQKMLLLSANGTYSFHRSGSTSIYVSGATGTSASESGAQGRWRIYEQAGKAMLELVPTSGTTEQIVLASEAGKTFLNGHRWLVGD
jgi:hypothetical protein